jgi:diguanylate cyclase (GGDEF)-like protein
MVRRDGEHFPANVSSTVFRDHSGEVRSSMIIRDVSEEKRNVERLVHLAQHDALTDLPNRLLLTDRLEVALAHARRAGAPLAVLFLDLDRFKNVNDSLGHDQGDRLLVEAAARLKACVRASDTVSRQGGDEFLVVLPGIDSAQDAARVAEKLIEAIARPFLLGEAEFVLTASIGIACFPENGADAETLLRNADAAMYAAKEAGRNRYQFYSAEMNARAHDRLLLEGDLRRALANDELFVVFQPQVDLASRALSGAEALVRWRHPKLGLVPPGDFIGIAEDSGQIGAIGAWVLEIACRQHAAWLAEGLLEGVVAVNVSALQFRQPEFLDTVAKALARSGLPAERLELEVTESAVMSGVEQTLQKLQRLHDMGVKLAIDDFGTGYSSLAYLRQFPINRLKIDQSFTKGLPEDRQSVAIAQAVIALGHSLGLNVLAEGIETPEQERHLRAAGCDTGQGYLYAKPLEAVAFAAYLRGRQA